LNLLFNNQLKQIKELNQKKGRLTQQKFIIEGIKPLQELKNSLTVPEMFVVEQGKESLPDLIKIKADFPDTPLYLCKDFSRISTLESPEGVLAICRIPVSTEFNTFLKNKNRLLALYQINDPGNLGTIIRTARWFGIDGIILISDCADEFNPKTVRSSMGAILKLPLYQLQDLKYVLSDLKDYQKIGSFVHSKHNYQDNQQQKKILFLGSEAHGLPEEYSQWMDANFLIPAKTEFESLNIAVAAGIMLQQIFS